MLVYFQYVTETIFNSFSLVKFYKSSYESILSSQPV